MFVLSQDISVGVFSCSGSNVIKFGTVCPIKLVTSNEVKQLALDIFDKSRCGSKKWHKVLLKKKLI